MPDATSDRREYLVQKERLLALLIYIAILVLISKLITGEWFPVIEGKRLWLVSGFGLWFFVLISAPFFRPPRDSLANAIVVGLVLSVVELQDVRSLNTEIDIFRWISVGLAVIVAITAVTAMVIPRADPAVSPGLAYLSKSSYRMSDALGRGEVMFTPPALISIIGFYQQVPLQQLWLLFTWTFLVSVKPVELVLRLVAMFRQLVQVKDKAEYIGAIRRVDNPNIIRVALAATASWDPDTVTVACLPNSDQVQVLPLFNHLQDAELVGTGLILGSPSSPISEAVPGHVYHSNMPVDASAIVNELSGLPGGADLIGFVVEGSTISTIQFEVSQQAELEEGLLTFCKQGGHTIYYQILDARTAEETFEQNPHGKHVVSAAQLGILDKKKGFTKYGWLPEMNTPFFLPKSPVTVDVGELAPDEFEVGKIPGSEIGVRVGFSDLLEYHAAILGVTGTGKTELALDIIHHALTQGAKIFCVDFTGEYRARLKDHDPTILSLEEDKAQALDKKLFAVDTGAYGAKDEKKALKEFVDEIIPLVKTSVSQFLTSDGPGLGIFDLPVITNTKATLRATELYLSSIMDWARSNRRARKILIVLEEAHTIIPETFGAGFDRDTQWVVGNISQIALQGRKYGVGLLVISQRTALVSKTILSQCNTNLTFSLVDKTSLDYLANVYSAERVRSIPNLRNLEAIAFGKAVRSERPVLIKLPYVQAKKDASDALNIMLNQKDDDKAAAEPGQVDAAKHPAQPDS